jgi:hypothetical protein
MDMAQAKVTTDHDEIRKWAKARGGCPAAVRRTHSKGNVGIIEAREHGETNASRHHGRS